MDGIERSRHALALAHLGRIAEAERLQRTVVGKFAKFFGAQSPELIEVRENLAETLELRGAGDEAASQRRLALTAAEAAYGKSSSEWAHCAQALAHGLLEQGGVHQLAEAQSLMDGAFTAYRMLPMPQPELGNLELDRGRAWLAQGKRGFAKEHLVAALDLLSANQEDKSSAEISFARRLLKEVDEVRDGRLR